MILSPPIPWRDVPAGAQVFIDGVPRTVLQNEPIYPGFPDDSRSVMIEGVAVTPIHGGLATVQLVIMDGDDAVANLLAAGFTATPIEEIR